MEIIEKKKILQTFILARNSQISFRNKLKNGTGTVSFPVLSIWIARGELNERSVTEGSARGDGRRKTQLYSNSLPGSNEYKTFIM